MRGPARTLGIVIALAGAALAAAPSARGAVAPVPGFPILGESHPWACCTHLGVDERGRIHLAGGRVLRTLSPGGTARVAWRYPDDSGGSLAVAPDGGASVVWGFGLDRYDPRGRLVARGRGDARRSVLTALPGGELLIGNADFGGAALLPAGSTTSTWSIDGRDGLDSVVPGERGRLYARRGRDVVALDAATGAVRWSVDAGYGSWLVSGGDGVYAAQSPVSPGGPGSVLAVASDGAVRWRASVPAGVARLAVAADGGVLAWTGDGALAALRPPDGVMRWRVPLGELAAGPVVTADGLVWAGLESGRLVAVRPDGTRAGGLPLGSPAEALVAGRDRVVALTRTGVLWAVREGASGRAGPPLLRVAPRRAVVAPRPIETAGPPGPRAARLPVPFGATAAVRTPAAARLTVWLRDDAGRTCRRFGPQRVPRGVARVRIDGSHAGRCAAPGGLLRPGRYVVVARLDAGVRPVVLRDRLVVTR